MGRNKVFVDTETTGLRPDYHELLEIYIIKEDPSGRILGEFHCIWIGHNPRFDYDFIQEGLFRAGVPGLRCNLIDTKVLAYEHLISLGSTSFDNIRSYLGWKTDEAHTAKFDTIQLRKFYYLCYRMSSFKRVYLYLKHRLHKWMMT